MVKPLLNVISIKNLDYSRTTWKSSGLTTVQGLYHLRKCHLDFILALAQCKKVCNRSLCGRRLALIVIWPLPQQFVGSNEEQ